MKSAIQHAALATVATVTSMLWASPALAKDKAPELAVCESSLGTIALVDGDTKGWTEWDLGSPRELVNALAVESGCFTPHGLASGEPARFLVTVIAGSQEEVDQSINVASGLASQALVSSGAASAVASKVPFGSAVSGLFGGFGGKKTTYAAGIRVVSPANGMTLASGSGSVKKESISFKNTGWASNAANASGYGDSKQGRRLTEAFVLAFNNLVAQRAALEMAPASAAAEPAAQVAVDTVMHASPATDSAELRKLRAGTELTPTGKREGLFIEASDSYGTTGWVSVEDLL